MPVDFEWEVGEENGEWLALAIPRTRRRWRPPRWVWYVLLALLLVGGGSTYIVLHQRYEQAQERLVFEIQSVMDLQARAYAEDDRELYIAQLDGQESWWWNWQERHRISDECRRADPPSPECAPFLPGVVEDVERRGEVALALVAEEGGTHRAHFYRRTSRGWLYTDPRAEFWEATTETGYKGLRVRVHRRDLPHVYPLLDHIAANYEQVCAPVGCRSGPFTIAFVGSLSTSSLGMQDDTLSVSSPWLTGIPLLENLDADVLSNLDTLVHQASLEHVFQLSFDDEPSLLRQALMAEYLDWTLDGHLGRAPLLRRLIDRNGIETLPQIIRSLPNNDSPEALARAWLALSPEADGHLFQFLLDVEHEALRAGQVETWLLFYDLGAFRQASPAIEGDRRAMFDTLRDVEDLPPPKVVSVEVSGDRARVVLGPHPGAPTDLPPAEFYVRQDGRWRHTAPYYALDHAQAQAAPPPDPGRTPIRFACNDYEVESYERLATAFAREHPGVAVEVVSLEEIPGLLEDADAFLYRLLTQVDATILPNTTLRTDGWLRDLAPLIAADPGFNAADVVGLAPDGPVWGLPVSLSPLMIHYDRAAFDAAGVPYPRFGWTADEFLAAAQALTVRQGEAVSRYGFVSMYPGDMAWLQGRVCAGEEVLAAPAMYDAVRWYADLSLDHGVMFGPRDMDVPAVTIESFWSEVPPLIQQGRVGMWAYAVPGWENAGSEMDYGIAPYPDMGCAANPVYVSGYAMSAGSRYPEETWQWLRYLSQRPLPFSFDPGRPASIPARRSLLPDYIRWQGWDADEMAAVLAALDRAVPIDDTFDPLRQAVFDVLNGRPAEVALARAQAAR